MIRVAWGIAVTALGGLMFLILAQFSPAVSKSTPGNAASLTAAGDGRFVVHEWGTFTTFAGSDGVQLDFRPLLDADLPSFVLNRERQAGARSMLTKSSLFGSVRMETPVTYFYVDEPRVVEVKVEFPHGLLTEFYPPVRSMLPAYNGPASSRGPSELNWGRVQLIPEKSLRPQLANEALSRELGSRLMAAAPPQEYGQFHYEAARATDAALVAVNLPPVDFAKSPALTLPPPGGLHLEKFLFYRGVGKFPLPLQAAVQQDGAVKIENTGADPIRSFFFIDVAPGANGVTIMRSQLSALESNSTATIPSPAEALTLPDLAQEVQRELVKAGLFEKEAMAMVNTWSGSWFSEPGRRLFYIVPTAVTNRVLPLHINPPPDESV
ncbi:MAG TPA: hypothetical protein VFG20_16975, partial [Planctomycetaceae bacterium]|nr:hypothetical protein [Planctomycetaceae bacterium]